MFLVLLDYVKCSDAPSELTVFMIMFQAANPGCILEDFVRWYSPPDWTENEASTEETECSDGGESLPTKGQLSQRMQKEGVLIVLLIIIVS